MENIIKIDLGCGPNKKDGFIGIDKIAFKGVDYICNLGSERLPFDDNSIDEVYISHFLEHLNAAERCHLVNDMYRVMKVDSKATVIVPHWASGRAYGDPTHKWPPVSEFWFYYLDKEWRMNNAPHTDKTNWLLGYECDFTCTWGYGLHQEILSRNQEYQTFATTFYKEAAQDIHATLIKVKR